MKVYFQVGAGRAAAVWPCRWQGWAGGVFREISFCRSGLDFFRALSRPLKITADAGENGGRGGWYRAGAGFVRKKHPAHFLHWAERTGFCVFDFKADKLEFIRFIAYHEVLLAKLPLYSLLFQKPFYSFLQNVQYHYVLPCL